MPEQRFLISDIGGTNIRLAWFADDPRQRRDVRTFRTDPKTNQPYLILTALKEYTQQVNQTFTAACMGMAGQVEATHVQITNRPDCVYRKDVADILKVDETKVLLINDMPPHLSAVDLLLPSELIEIHPGVSGSTGARGVLMPGTGVGVGGAVTAADQPHRPFPSEGGHIDFAPRDEQQDRLLKFLRPMAKEENIGWVSNEFVFAGDGIRRIYAFLQNPDSTSLDGCPRSEDITAAASTGNLPATDLRRQTIELYLKILGAAAGNLALMLDATGGIYLGGSICLCLRKLLPTPVFLDAFLTSGPPSHREMIADVPVRLIDYVDSGLLGAGALAKGLAT
jgi:glucokinase